MVWNKKSVEYQHHPFFSYTKLKQSPVCVIVGWYVMYVLIPPKLLRAQTPNFCKRSLLQSKWRKKVGYVIQRSQLKINFLKSVFLDEGKHLNIQDKINIRFSNLQKI